MTDPILINYILPASLGAAAVIAVALYRQYVRREMGDEVFYGKSLKSPGPTANMRTDFSAVTELNVYGSPVGRWTVLMPTVFPSEDDRRGLLVALEDMKQKVSSADPTKPPRGADRHKMLAQPRLP